MGPTHFSRLRVERPEGSVCVPNHEESAQYQRVRVDFWGVGGARKMRPEEFSIPRIKGTYRAVVRGRVHLTVRVRHAIDVIIKRALPENFAGFEIEGGDHIGGVRLVPDITVRAHKYTPRRNHWVVQPALNSNLGFPSNLRRFDGWNRRIPSPCGVALKDRPRAVNREVTGEFFGHFRLCKGLVHSGLDRGRRARGEQGPKRQNVPFTHPEPRGEPDPRRLPKTGGVVLPFLDRFGWSFVLST